ncbi:hypothetical protein NEFER03_0740 [Nematocida sp. LUAm3]|nr:hypothetical protein NEFER03_0740 [Nematocida sp. LUAm3]KAI5175199.1 hypothetical protein NEFER02_1160 [Nematocida sp. LUAm2]KAI5178129.1 hypothetical protein NEFER01_1307 [Nematocida sp. LUAm1]
MPQELMKQSRITGFLIVFLSVCALCFCEEHNAISVEQRNRVEAFSVIDPLEKKGIDPIEKKVLNTFYPEIQYNTQTTKEVLYENEEQFPIKSSPKEEILTHTETSNLLEIKDDDKSSVDQDVFAYFFEEEKEEETKHLDDDDYVKTLVFDSKKGNIKELSTTSPQHSPPKDVLPKDALPKDALPKSTSTGSTLFSFIMAYFSSPPDIDKSKNFPKQKKLLSKDQLKEEKAARAYLEKNQIEIPEGVNLHHLKLIHIAHHNPIYSTLLLITLSIQVVFLGILSLYFKMRYSEVYNNLISSNIIIYSSPQCFFYLLSLFLLIAYAIYSIYIYKKKVLVRKKHQILIFCLIPLFFFIPFSLFFLNSLNHLPSYQQISLIILQILSISLFSYIGITSIGSYSTIRVFIIKMSILFFISLILLFLINVLILSLTASYYISWFFSIIGVFSIFYGMFLSQHNLIQKQIASCFSDEKKDNSYSRSYSVDLFTSVIIILLFLLVVIVMSFFFTEQLSLLQNLLSKLFSQIITSTISSTGLKEFFNSAADRAKNTASIATTLSI